MAVNTAKVEGRRQLRFADFTQLLKDAETVATTPTKTLGNWSVAQILDHLAVSANCAFDGYGTVKGPWFVRNLVIPFVKNNLLTKPMSPGIRLPKNASVLLPSNSITAADAFAKLRKAMDRFTTELPGPTHPVLGSLAFQEWVAFTLRHAEMHLSFIIPTESPVPA